MPSASSKKPGPKRRTLTDEFRAKVLADAVKVGVPEAAAKHGVVPSMVYSWRAKGVAGQGKSKQLQIVARKLSAAVRTRLMEGHELGEVEIYATLLTREIMR